MIQNPMRVVPSTESAVLTTALPTPLFVAVKLEPFKVYSGNEKVEHASNSARALSLDFWGEFAVVKAANRSIDRALIEVWSDGKRKRSKAYLDSVKRYLGIFN
jgi:hypothetical protein